MSAQPFDWPVWIRNEIKNFLESPANDMRMPSGPEPAFGPALVAFAAGADPLWQDFKTHVGSFHWTPLEAFALAFPDEAPAAGELAVISWILPQTRATVRDHRKETANPSERWARSRIMGEQFVNDGLKKYLAERLTQAGVRAFAPTLLPQWGQKDSKDFTYSSTWSERHAAYAAGLGTFGLCDGLITPLGKAMRAGSLITRLPLPASPRPYTDHRAYCLFFSSGACGLCVKKCPSGALSKDGHDKKRCSDYVFINTARYVREHYHFDGYGCGFCQVGVPCESGIPGKG